MFSITGVIASDYTKHIEILGQLTFVGKIDRDTYVKTLKIITDTPGHYMVAVRDKEIMIAAGTLIVEQKIIHECGKVGHIEDIVVDSDYRNMGVGKLLVTRLIDMAKNLECYKVILDCADETKNFYIKCGLVPNEIEMVLYL